MIGSLLLCLPASLSAGEHAVLHPADATLYLELPDISAAVAAYCDAPLLRVLTGAGLSSAVAGVRRLPEPEGFDLAAAARSAVEDRLEDLPWEARRGLELVATAQSASISLRAGNDGALIAALAGGELLGGGIPYGALHALEGGGFLVVLELPSADASGEAVYLMEGGLGAAGVLPDTENMALLGESAKVRRYSIPSGAGDIELWFTRVGARLLLGGGTTTPESVATRAADPSAPFSIASTADRGAARAAFGETGGAPIYEAVVRVEGVSDLVASLVGSRFPDAEYAGRTLARNFFYGDRLLCHRRVQLTDGRFVTDSFTPEGTGILGSQPLDAQSFAMLPAEAVGAWAADLDADALAELIETLIADLSGMDPEFVLSSLEAGFGFRFSEDLFGSLGRRMVFYCMPITGIALPKLVLAVELEDAAAFERGVSGLAAFLEEVAGDELSLSTKPYRKTPLVTLTPAGGGAPSGGGAAAMMAGMFSPQLAIGVLGDRALFALNSLHVKREVKRLLRENTERHLAAEAGFFPSGVVDAGHTDWGAIVGGFYEAARALAPMAGQFTGGELPVDLTALPDGKLLTEHLQPSVSWNLAVEGGVLRHRESSFGPETHLGLAAGIGYLVTMGFPSGNRRGSGGEELPRVVVEAVPAGPTPLEITIDHLRSVKVALVVYKSDGGRYPAELRSLLDATASFPQGFLDPKEFLDGWDAAFIYGASDDGRSFTLHSAGPDGADQGGGGDDVPLP
ncbi:MAG: hypothetical protein CMJ84_04960 [Planctomycetes bacterium]|nr:hypothetical protein [Planctomycetota bacterium]MDP6407997.1 type II secretion system protein GspG [Planctomycetota bacterium]